MSDRLRIPEYLSDKYTGKQGWYEAEDASNVLDWIESEGGKFLGFDVAERTDDDRWMLLTQPIQDLSDEADTNVALKLGREFLEDHRAKNRIFEPVWEGRYP